LKTKASFKNLPNFVTQQVSKNLVRAINQGENILRIQLKPPELGRLLITIDNSGSNIKINIMTENSAAREILTSNVNELRTVLSNSGVNLERFEVDMSSDFRQSMADARNQAWNFGK
ncbi:MAG: flagellar hook-length control protein FliK, partial [Deltaproteobacteria bacterium]